MPATIARRTGSTPQSSASGLSWLVRCQRLDAADHRIPPEQTARRLSLRSTIAVEQPISRLDAAEQVLAQVHAVARALRAVARQHLMCHARLVRIQELRRGRLD